MSNEIIDGLNYLKDTKELIRQSIIDKGVEVDSSLPFRQYADKIGEMSITVSGDLQVNISPIETHIEIQDL